MRSGQRAKLDAALRFLFNRKLPGDIDLVESTPCGLDADATAGEAAIAIIGDAIERRRYFANDAELVAPPSAGDRFRAVHNGEPAGDWKTKEQLVAESGQPFYPERRTSEASEADRLLDELHSECREASRRGVSAGLVYYHNGWIECFVNRGRLHEPSQCDTASPELLPWLRGQIHRVRGSERDTP